MFTPVNIFYFSAPSQSTTEAERGGEGLREEVGKSKGMTGEGESSAGTEVFFQTLNIAEVQALNSAVAKTMNEEQEELGKV